MAALIDDRGPWLKRAREKKPTRKQFRFYISDKHSEIFPREKLFFDKIRQILQICIFAKHLRLKAPVHLLFRGMKNHRVSVTTLWFRKKASHSHNTSGFYCGSVKPQKQATPTKPSDVVKTIRFHLSETAGLEPFQFQGFSFCLLLFLSCNGVIQVWK